MNEPRRREVLGGLAALAAGCGAEQTPSGANTNAAPDAVETTMKSELRTLGKTGAKVEAFSLGGEGVLRTQGREREAVPMILASRDFQPRKSSEGYLNLDARGVRGASFRVRRRRPRGSWPERRAGRSLAQGLGRDGGATGGQGDHAGAAAGAVCG